MAAWSGSALTAAWSGSALTAAWSGSALTAAWSGSALMAAWSGSALTAAWSGSALTAAWSGSVLTAAWPSAAHCAAHGCPYGQGRHTAQRMDIRMARGGTLRSAWTSVWPGAARCAAHGHPYGQRRHTGQRMDVHTARGGAWTAGPPEAAQGRPHGQGQRMDSRMARSGAWTSEWPAAAHRRQRGHGRRMGRRMRTRHIQATSRTVDAADASINESSSSCITMLIAAVLSPAQRTRHEFQQPYAVRTRWLAHSTPLMPSNMHMNTWSCAQQGRQRELGVPTQLQGGAGSGQRLCRMLPRSHLRRKIASRTLGTATASTTRSYIAAACRHGQAMSPLARDVCDIPHGSKLVSMLRAWGRLCARPSRQQQSMLAQAHPAHSSIAFETRV
eukprot:364794-Chlamydomonas_euryale.AAC.21